jgi:predicted PurR-regulated permease PerM
MRSDDVRPIPWRTIWAVIGSVVLTVAALLLLNELHRLLVWVVLAVFLAVILTPPVEFLVARTGMRRGLATAVVFVVALALVAGMIFAFAHPLYVEGQDFVDDLPRLVEEARQGRGPLGDLVTRFDLEQRITDQQEQLRGSIGQLGSQSMRVLGKVGSAIAGTLTVLVLAFLIIMDAPRLTAAARTVLPPDRWDRVARVAGDSSRAVTGYMTGNLLISAVAGVGTYLLLWILGVPFKGVLALFVGMADLVPLVGATLGAAVVVIVAFIHSPTAGIATIVFFVVYQQIENHVLQPLIQSRTVKLSPLVVLVSALMGVELAGILGALLAIPLAGVIKVVARDLWDDRQRRLDPEPTVGVDAVPTGDTLP